MSKVISRDEMQLHLGDFNTLLQRQPYLLESVGVLVSFLGTCITKRQTHNCPKVLLGYEILSQ